MLRTPVPPFIRTPAHVDGNLMYAAALRLESKLYAAMPEIDEALSKLEPDRIDGPAGYWKEWFRRKSDNFLSYLQIYAYIVSMAIPESKPDIAKVRLLDFGGGWGLMGILAKEAGVGHVAVPVFLAIGPYPIAVFGNSPCRHYVVSGNALDALLTSPFIP